MISTTPPRSFPSKRVLPYASHAYGDCATRSDGIHCQTIVHSYLSLRNYEFEVLEQTDFRRRRARDDLFQEWRALKNR